MSLRTQIKKLADARKTYEKELKNLGRGAAKGIAEHLGELIPKGYALEWTGGTPEYNDGEPCEFTMHTPVFFALEVPDGVDDEDGVDRTCLGSIQEDSAMAVALDGYSIEYRFQKADAPEMPGVTEKILKGLATAWEEIPEDMLEQVFGDGHCVRVLHGGKYVREDWTSGY